MFEEFYFKKFNLNKVICLHIVYIKHFYLTYEYQVLPLRVRVDLEAMAVKGLSTFLKALAFLETHHQIIYSYIQDTRYVCLTHQWRRSRCILQPQLTGLFKKDF